MKTRVDVVILTYDGLELVDECLSSLLKQSVKPAKIIVVDNGSKDGTLEFINDKYPIVELVHLPVNVGIPAAFNKGLSRCDSEYVAWLNNDTILERDWLCHIYEVISSDAAIASCDSLVLYNDERTKIWSMGASYSVSGAAGLIAEGDDTSQVDIISNKVVIATVGCAAIYRKSLFDELGQLDDTFFLGFEDVDWSLRATLAGYTNYNVPSAVVYHKVSQTVEIGSAQYVRNGQRNVTATFFVNMPKLLLILFLPFHLLYQMTAFLYYLYHLRGYTWLMAKVDNIKRIKSYIIKRKQVQNYKKISIIRFYKLLSWSLLGSKFKLRIFSR